MGAELHFQVLVVRSKKKELDHLVLPQAIGDTRRLRRSPGVAVERSRNIDDQATSKDAQSDSRHLPGCGELPIPRSIDQELRQTLVNLACELYHP